MLKYSDTKVVFREVPNEITLAINISGCPIRCPGCHSKWLWENNGTTLDDAELEHLFQSNTGCTCVAFMGGDAEPLMVKALSETFKKQHPEIKICWYSGRPTSELQRLISDGYLYNIDYLKLGPYDKSFGGLDSETTNQRFYELLHSDGTIQMKDITYKFQ